MNAKGGCSSVMGCAENKRKKERKRRAWACGLDRVGLKPGRVRMGFIRVWRPFFLIFPLFFSLFPPLESKTTLSSLLLPSSSPMRRNGQRWWSEAAMRWPVVLDGGAAALKVFFFLYFFFRAYSSTFPSLFISGLKTSKIFIKKPRSKKKGRKLYFLFFDSDSNV